MPQNNTQQDVSQATPFPVHGNFCGIAYPEYQSTNPQDHAGRISQIQPQDDLDAACKKHDICYAMNSFGSEHCDEDLVKNVRLISVDIEREETRYCGTKINAMVAYFERKNGKSYYRIPRIMAATILAAGEAGISGTKWYLDFQNRSDARQKITDERSDYWKENRLARDRNRDRLKNKTISREKFRELEIIRRADRDNNLKTNRLQYLEHNSSVNKEYSSRPIPNITNLCNTLTPTQQDTVNLRKNKILKKQKTRNAERRKIREQKREERRRNRRRRY